MVTLNTPSHHKIQLINCPQSLEKSITVIFMGIIPLADKIEYIKHYLNKVSKGAKIRNRYNQVPHLTQNTNGKVTNSQLDTTNESQEVSPFTAGDHKAHINRRAQRHSKHLSGPESFNFLILHALCRLLILK